MESTVEIIKISDADFDETIVESGKVAVVDFWATWCEPCRQLEGILEDIASSFAGKVTFYKVDVNESSKTASKYAVRSIPMLLFFKDGELVDRAVGALSREVLLKKIGTLAESA